MLHQTCLLLLEHPSRRRVICAYRRAAKAEYAYAQNNPLGHEVTLMSAVMLNLGALLGPGIFAVSGVVLASVGSVGLLLSFWVLAPVFAYGMK